MGAQQPQEQRFEGRASESAAGFDRRRYGRNQQNAGTDLRA